MQAYISLLDCLSLLDLKPDEGARIGPSHRYITSRTTPGSSMSCSEPALTPSDSGEHVLLYCSSCLWSYKCCFSYHKLDPRHPDALCDTGECNILAKKQMLKCYNGITSLILGLLYLFCFPGHFFPTSHIHVSVLLLLPAHRYPRVQFPRLQPLRISHAGSQRVTPVPRTRSRPPRALGPLSSP